MVGDRGSTDGAFAVTLGCPFALVRSGVTLPGELVDVPVAHRRRRHGGRRRRASWPATCPDSMRAMAKNNLQKLLESGVQFTEMTRQQAEAAVKSLVKAGEVRRSETEAMVQSLIDRGRATAAQIAESVQNEVTRQLGWLANRVDDVEDQLETFVTRVTAGEITVPGLPGTAGQEGAGRRRRPRKKAATPRRRPAQPKAGRRRRPPAKKAPAKKAAAKKAAAKKVARPEARRRRPPAKKAAAKKARPRRRGRDGLDGRRRRRTPSAPRASARSPPRARAEWAPVAASTPSSCDAASSTSRTEAGDAVGDAAGARQRRRGRQAGAAGGAGDALVVTGPPPRFVGRGGEKLDAALDASAIDVTGLRALDAGASTGGFTDCLLPAGRRRGRRRRRRPRPAAPAPPRRSAGRRAGAHQHPRRRRRRRSAGRSTSSSPTCRSSRCAVIAAVLVDAVPAWVADGAARQAAVRGGPGRGRPGPRRDHRPGDPRAGAATRSTTALVDRRLRRVVGWMDSPITRRPTATASSSSTPCTAAGSRRDAASLLVAHHERAEVAATLARDGRRLARRARPRGVGRSPDDATALGLADLVGERPPDRADLVVSLGGDGTMLRTVQLLDGAPVPLLGVNVGLLGYLTEVEPPELDDALERFVAGPSGRLAARRADDARRQRVAPAASARARGGRSTRPSSRSASRPHRPPAGAHRRRAVHLATPPTG